MYDAPFCSLGSSHRSARMSQLPRYRVKVSRGAKGEPTAAAASYSTFFVEPLRNAVGDRPLAVSSKPAIQPSNSVSDHEIVPLVSPFTAPRTSPLPDIHSPAPLVSDMSPERSPSPQEPMRSPPIQVLAMDSLSQVPTVGSSDSSQPLHSEQGHRRHLWVPRFHSPITL